MYACSHIRHLYKITFYPRHQGARVRSEMNKGSGEENERASVRNFKEGPFPANTTPALLPALATSAVLAPAVAPFALQTYAADPTNPAGASVIATPFVAVPDFYYAPRWWPPAISLTSAYNPSGRPGD